MRARRLKSFGPGLWAFLLVLGAPASGAWGQCVGDCNDDKEVTVDELLRGTNIALGILELDVCPAFDDNGDEEVTVDEILMAVGFALDGCEVSLTPTSSPVPTATPTPVSSATATATLTATGTFTASPTRTATATATATVTPTATDTPLPGPQITYFGLAKTDGVPYDVFEVTPDGTPVYKRSFGAGFVLVIEAKPGPSNSPPRTTLFNSNPGDPSARPDVQIQVDRNLGNGSLVVCDSAGPDPEVTPGGIPGINPPSYDPGSQMVADALNDLSCRFADNTVDKCTINERKNPAFVNPESSNQVCTAGPVSGEYRFADGDTLLTVRWRDAAGVLGGPARMIVRIAP